MEKRAHTREEGAGQGQLWFRTGHGQNGAQKGARAWQVPAHGRRLGSVWAECKGMALPFGLFLARSETSE